MDAAAGELICEMCGLVLSSSIIDYGQEWRAFELGEYMKRSRVGSRPSLTFHDTGLSTTIDWKGKDIYGRNLRPDQRAQIFRLIKWQNKSKATKTADRSLIYALKEITKAGYKLHLPRNVVETAAYNYRLAVKKRLVKGRSVLGMVAACIYIACRQCNVIRRLDEVAQAAHVSKRNAWRIYHSLIRNLEAPVPRVPPHGYVSRYVNQLSLSGEAENIALRILETAAELKLMDGRSPAGMAAGATYIACLLTSERRTQDQFAQAGWITTVTVRNRYQELRKMMMITLDV